MPTRLRRAVAADVPALAALYGDTARRLGAWCYSAEQVAAWQSFAADAAGFRDYVLGAETWLAFDCDGSGDGASLLGFSGIDAAGEVHSLYVRHDLVRQGLGTQLLAHGLACARESGITTFTAWATPFSLPVFQRAGFRLAQTLTVPYQGVLFERYRVALGAADADT